jgi:hypothetical protein
VRPREQIESLVLGFLAVIGGLVFFFGLLLSVWCLIAAYVAGIFAVTARGSRIAPTTLVCGAGAGVAGGLIVYAATWLGRGFLDSNPLLPLVVIVAPPAIRWRRCTADHDFDPRHHGDSPSPASRSNDRGMLQRGSLQPR